MWGYHSPSSTAETKVLHLNQVIFDGFEQALREGKPTGTFLWMTFVTVAHEFSHYLTSVCDPPQLPMNPR
jgi:hypothetical protein